MRFNPDGMAAPWKETSQPQDPGTQLRSLGILLLLRFVIVERAHRSASATTALRTIGLRR
jgi:hypothetical protein